MTPELLAQLYSQESSDPFICLLTLTHPSWGSPIRLAGNSANIISNGNTYSAYPFKLVLPVDDGERSREVTIEFDNVSLELIDELRSVTTEISVKIEIVLASIPNEVQILIDDLKTQSISYDKSRIRARLYLDSFLNTEATSEKYTPSNFPGLF